MRHLLSVILAAVVLVAVVTGCDGMWRYDARLVAADSLMHDHPDSALALVQAIELGSLTRERDRAYRDLLLTQGRYRSYVPAPSDSDINRALDYYRRHKGEREKLTRAYIYKGAVMEELGHPDSAMLYYKHAEATAAPDDYFNLGYINLKIGELYQFHFITTDSIIRARMLEAMRFFIASRDTNYIVISMGTLGSYLNKQNPDSAKLLLFQAISMAQSANLPKQYYYQSKLAGLFFYQQDYIRAKQLALDIIFNGKDHCSENTFYYYAARSFIRLGDLDSAYWVTSIIPAPVTSLDSFNYYLLKAELAQTSNRMLDYSIYSTKAERIHRRIIESSSNSTILSKELESDALLQQAQTRNEYQKWILMIVIAVVVAFFAVVAISRLILHKKNKRFQRELNNAHKEIEKMLNQSDQQITLLIAEREKDKEQIRQINRELSQVNKSYRQLEQAHQDIHKKASAIVRQKNVALKELHEHIRIIVQSEGGGHKSLSLNSIIKDFNESRKIRLLAPKESFWKKMKMAVDLEYDGIATFVEKNYPQLSIKELHLFWLLCANVSPQIIKLCMNYTSIVTVSNNKRRLMKDSLGMDIKLDDFISLYLKGELCNR